MIKLILDFTIRQFDQTRFPNQSSGYVLVFIQYVYVLPQTTVVRMVM
jgi:hypothetical protein